MEAPMVREKILARLADPKTLFLEKLWLAIWLEVDLWEDRNPPNLGDHELKKLMRHIPANLQPTWSARNSQRGKHGKTGDDEVFKFEFKTKLLGFEMTYFVKGYFFDKGNCHGVCIQSFREVSRVKISFRVK
jgi:hypothetical protein